MYVHCITIHYCCVSLQSVMCENTLIKDKQAPFRAEAINAFHYKRYNSCESLRQGQCFYLTWQKKTSGGRDG